jgi:choline kinase
MKVETPKIDQALIAAGGNGKRLKGGGVDIPLAKSFISLEGKPLLYWNLKGLVDAGINRLVITSDTKEKLRRAETVVDDIATMNDVQDVTFFQDQGLGTNGLPHYTKDLLDEEFIFDFGHNITLPSHYEKLRSSKTPDVVVFSGFEPNGYSDHPVTHVNTDTGIAQENSGIHTRRMEVAAPFVLDQQWVAQIPLLDFTFAKMVQERAQRKNAVVVFSELPIEIDTSEDFKRTMPIYERLV